jgi:fatty acid synthase
MENVGIRYIKATEIYKDNLLAPEIVQIIEAEANFYVRIFWLKV